MNTKLLKKIMIIVIFIFHITTIIISYANPLFKELNFGEHIFGASTILNLTLLSKINFSFAYFITLILGIVIIVPLSSISNVGKVISNYKELIRMHKMPVSSDEEQIEKTNKIIDFYYDSGISLGSIIAKLLAMVIFTYYAYVIITAGQNYTFLENSNLNFLWFNLNEKEVDSVEEVYLTGDGDSYTNIKFKNALKDDDGFVTALSIYIGIFKLNYHVNDVDFDEEILKEKIFIIENNGKEINIIQKGNLEKNYICNKKNEIHKKYCETCNKNFLGE